MLINWRKCNIDSHCKIDSHPAPSPIEDAMDAAQSRNESSASGEDDENPSEVIAAADENIVSRDGSHWQILDPS